MIPVILSGGSGSRLWPISRASYPKQFCQLLDESLLTKTIKRLSAWGAPRIVTVEQLKTLTDNCMQQAGLPVENIMYEPQAKNTAPAIALLCHELRKNGLESEIVGVFPADHMITDEPAFGQAVNLATLCAKEGQIVTIGIKPDYPSTGFGYIECSKNDFKSQGDLSGYIVKAFKEKPALLDAETYVAAKNYYWNAGMFVFRVQDMIAAFEEHLPSVWGAFEASPEDVVTAYSQVEPVSIDYGIMEKIGNQVCVPCMIGWSDLGSWDDFSKEAGTTLPQAEVVPGSSTYYVDAKNNFTMSDEGKTVGYVGVSNLIVVDTPDALLIAKKGHTQSVKQLVEELKKSSNLTSREHPFDFRPWGKYEILAENKDYKVKEITVNPRAQLSYQSHEQRNEHWIIIEGDGEVVFNDEVIKVAPGTSLFIPKQSKHRMRNTSDEILRFVEVQTGDYFGEDDITRYEDDYKRV